MIFKRVNDKCLKSGLDRIKANLQSCVNKGKMSQEKFEKVFFLAQDIVDYGNFWNMDMVIKAVIENVALKQQIISDLEKHRPSHCVLATNTSTKDLNLIDHETNSQDRIVGAHFFSPARIMPLLEIEALNCTGLAVNRMFFPYTQSAILLTDTDIASIMGIGYPPYRGCVTLWADSLGTNYNYSKLKVWAAYDNDDDRIYSVKDRSNVKMNLQYNILMGSTMKKLMGINMDGERDAQKPTSVHFMSKNIGNFPSKSMPRMLYFNPKMNGVGLCQREIVLHITFYLQQRFDAQ